MKKQKLVEKAKKTTLKYTVVLLALSIALIVGGYVKLEGLAGSISVALGLALGAASPLLAFYLTYRRIIKPELGETRGSEAG